MILRVLRESETGELTVEVREFEEPFGVEATSEVFAEALTEGELLAGVVGASVSVGDGLGGDWLMRPEWWAVEVRALGELLVRESEEAQARGRLIQRIFVWVPTDDEEHTRKLLWLLSGGELWIGGSPSCGGEDSYPHHGRMGQSEVPEHLRAALAGGPAEELVYGRESRWYKPEGKKPEQGSLDL